MLDMLHFTGCFVRSPSTVGALLPSSGALADAIARRAHGRRQVADTLIELGAGTGSITRRIDHGLFRDYVAFECNEKLAGILQTRHPELRVHALAVPEPVSESYVGRNCTVISSIPFRSLPEDDRREVAAYIERLLAANRNNTLIQYSYFPAVPFVPGNTGLRWQCSGIVLANLPPAFIWELAHTDTG
ncbi:MAG: hypothetical protein CGU28_06490 [Candidatus Dactylopiibacterium carminicum]|uniref:Phospholipid methyltransferase n=1 Tax=Candidatus Dactylopiibacterium carminicum TaxID=857335 RepID=A0A272EWI5_9RHOO|nr:hypothetical protein [Candidatus Dactylopiibacterium carminicum]KAF7599945.1 hypothetical protein BGI27_04970 [Candidatus Dactylopiibacterium carminicum]PAS94474.1 MAG: hypothetical protein CGU29_03970 [Candidatus Dactylopiibacterium carminicum]PAS97041.1 MAG: hypothetical protein CGU28_06490 [Candidatus Dactylopiibacterium carminicum]PAS99948.1 MAG: hypothetical protein BSR46_05005 [Candidatus Dactylopiibacterium carminicum]